MTTCLGKSCSFGLLCVSFENVYQFVCASFPFGFEAGLWDLIVFAFLLLSLVVFNLVNLHINL